MKIIRRTCEKVYDLGFDPILNKIFSSRGVKSSNELKYELKNLLQPNMLGMEEACSLIINAIKQQKKIRIVGDYDADGATSTTLALKFFRDIAYSYVDFYIPKRSIEGYGINNNIVDKAHAQGIDFIITVDNGISAHEAIAHAKDLGITVVVTDHHLPSDTLPIADAIVNPHQKGCPFPSKCLAGVGVIFYVLCRVKTLLKENGYFTVINTPEPKMWNYLDLVAIGTLSDMVPLDYNNRILCMYGIWLIRNMKISQGLKELIKIAGSTSKNFKSTDVSFSICPRLNAAGRIADMSIGVSALLAEECQDAKSKVLLLQTLNIERKKIEDEMLNKAIHKLAQMYPNLDMPAIVIYDSSFHIGIVGIVANRLKDLYKVPAFVFADCNNDNIAGSVRSVDGYHIYDALARINNQESSCIVNFGGHAGAAGISIAPSYLDDFRRAVFQDIEIYGQETDTESSFVTDGELPGEYFLSSIARTLCFAHPWGQDFEQPLFDGVFVVLGQYIISPKFMRLLLKLPNGRTIYGVCFNQDQTKYGNLTARVVRLVYHLDIPKNSDDGIVNIVIKGIDILNNGYN